MDDTPPEHIWAPDFIAHDGVRYLELQCVLERDAENSYLTPIEPDEASEAMPDVYGRYRQINYLKIVGICCPRLRHYSTPFSERTNPELPVVIG